MDILEIARTRGIYFFLVDHEPLLHLSIVLAQGLSALGVPVFANTNAVRRGDDFLFKKSDVWPASAYCIVVDLGGPTPFNDADQVLSFVRTLGHRTVALSMADTANDSAMPSDIPTFATHHSIYFLADDGRIPWAFGLTDEMIARARVAKAHERRRAFVRNFRWSWTQEVRAALDLAFVPSLEKHFEIDRRTDAPGHFSTNHFERLATSVGCLAYGGFIGYPPICSRTIVDRPVIGRWDSWRFWESLISGALTVHLDFDAYGFRLPVMPAHREVYFGLRMDALAEQAAELAAMSNEQMATIGSAGRAWALEQYAPMPTALRFLETVARVTK